MYVYIKYIFYEKKPTDDWPVSTAVVNIDITRNLGTSLKYDLL